MKAEKKDYYVEVILEEITQMDQMIVEMLEISKFDAGVVNLITSIGRGKKTAYKKYL